MNKLKFWLRNYFAFSQTEIRSFLTISVLMVVILLVTFINKFTNITNNYTAENASQDKEILQKWVAEIDKKQQAYEAENPKKDYQKFDKQGETGKQASFENSTNKAYTLFAFEPNVADEQTFIKLGLPKFMAQRIVNYRNKGGKFKIKADFKKIYGLLPEKYEELVPYIQLPESLDKQPFAKENTEKQANNYPNTQENKPTYTPKKPTNFDMNEADTTTLKNIKGIGSVLADRIVKFRNNLGGFHSLEQVREVYGIQPEVVEELAKYANFGTAVKKININLADEATLKAHPYIGYKIASVIVAYRKQHGNFSKPEDLLKIKLLNNEKLEKIKPYLEF
jgi:competence protein ComEA